MTAQNQQGDNSPQAVRLAEFRVVGPGAAGEPIPVHFNPETLEYTVTNNIKEQGNSSESKQQVSKSSGKLSMELIFDTTMKAGKAAAGSDVRAETEKLQALMKPTEEGDEKIAPVVEFAWGTYRFKGIFTSYKETLDFFSSTGVPLRASIAVTMTQQDGLFDPTAKGDDVDVDDAPTFSPSTPSEGGDDDNRGPATGDPQTDRALAEDNGEENPRFFSGRELSLPSGPNLQPPAAFASAGISGGLSFGAGLDIGLDIGLSAGVSAGLGIGLGIEAGIDVGLSASFDFDIGIDLEVEAKIDVGIGGSVAASVSSSGSSSGSSAGGIGGGAPGPASGGGSGSGAGLPTVAALPDAERLPMSGAFGSSAWERSGPDAPVRSRQRGAGPSTPGDDLYDGLPLGPRFGGNTSAGVPASAGAFAGLRPAPPRRRRPLSLSKLRGRRPERELRTDAGAAFEIGGQALERSPTGLGADVGARATLADSVSFDDFPESG